MKHTTQGRTGTIALPRPRTKAKHNQKDNDARSRTIAMHARRAHAAATEARPSETNGMVGLGVSAPSHVQGRKAERGKTPHVLVAGGGIGGLCLAIALQNRGVDVTVFERVKEYRPFGGPIQLQSNALGALEAIDPELAQDVIANGVVTGDRINGMLDGKSGEWYFKFDTREPAVKHGLPLTIVINRYTLLDLLTARLKPGVLQTGKEVIAYAQNEGVVRAQLADGTDVLGDALVACDGIHSKIRAQMKGSGDPPAYSGFTVYTATCNYQPADVEEVGYQVFLGYNKYFVSSDVGGGQAQWYAFHAEPAGGSDEGCMKQRVAELFEEFCPAVQDRIEATVAKDIERRDIFDRIPTMSWVDGNVALLGDAAHAMQPNLGQGGGQAIEDAFVLSQRIAGCDSLAHIPVALHSYSYQRMGRAATVAGLSRMASFMTTTYRRYLGENPHGFYKHVPGLLPMWKKIEDLRVPHPGRVIGQIAMMSSMQSVLEYVAAGVSLPPEDRIPYCQLPGVAVPRRNIPKSKWMLRGLPGFAK